MYTDMELEQTITLGTRILSRDDLQSCSMGHNESFMIYLKNGDRFVLTRGEPGYNWVFDAYREAWKNTIRDRR